MSTPRQRITVEVFLRASHRDWEWVLPVCPECGEEHVHYGGRLYENPRRSLGLRVYYCHLRRREHRDFYNLVDTNPAATDRLIADAREERRRQAA